MQLVEDGHHAVPVIRCSVLRLRNSTHGGPTRCLDSAEFRLAINGAAPENATLLDKMPASPSAPRAQAVSGVHNPSATDLPGRRADEGIFKGGTLWVHPERVILADGRRLYVQAASKTPAAFTFPARHSKE